MVDDSSDIYCSAEWYTSQIPLERSIAAAIKENPANLLATPGSRAHEVANKVARGRDLTDQERLDLPEIALWVTKRWMPGSLVNIAFLGGSQIQQNKVRKYIARWAVGSVRFAFVSDPFKAKIRISFDTSSPPRNWSKIGTDCLTTSPPEATMNFGSVTDTSSDRNDRYFIMHETGHALGLVHEHQSPANPIQWNVQAVYNDLMGPPNYFTKKQVDDNIFYAFATSQMQYSVFDPTSIMVIPIKASWTTNGFSIAQTEDLSALDKSSIAAWYPPAGQIPGAGISSSPSVAAFYNVLYCFHQGAGDDHWLWWARSTDGQTWTTDEKVPNVGMGSSPSAVVFKNKLYCFHQGYGNNGQLWYDVWDGVRWSGDANIPAGMSASPSGVVFNDKLYCFHQGYGDNGQLWYVVWDGARWSGDANVPNVTISWSPSAVVFKDKLYCFHQGAGKNGELRYVVWDGSKWSQDLLVPNVGMSRSPCPVVFNDKLYCFHQGSGLSGMMQYTVTTDGVTWAPDMPVDNVGMSSSPAAVIYNDKLYCFYQGYANNGRLWYVMPSLTSAGLDVPAESADLEERARARRR